MADMFESSDHDGKGYISLLDFQIILSNNKSKNYNMKDLEYLLRMYDSHGNRKISFQDFAYQLMVRVEREI